MCGKKSISGTLGKPGKLKKKRKKVSKRKNVRRRKNKTFLRFEFERIDLLTIFNKRQKNEKKSFKDEKMF